MLLDPNKFADFLEERAAAHDGYIMCAVGQDPKTLNEWYFSGQYNGEQLKKANEWRETAERVWDCQGLADGYVTEMTGVKTNVRARNNYAEWCGIKADGDIPAERRVRGAAVFRRGSYIEHVGWLVRPVNENNPAGDWWVVEARGVMHGVVRTKLSQRNWNCWGWMTEKFDYSLAETDVPGEYRARNLYRGLTGEDVKELQLDLIALNYSCGKWGADGEFGKATQSALEAFQKENGLVVDGIAGPATFARLDELLAESGDMEEEEPVKGILISAGRSWCVRTQPHTSAPVLGYVARGELYAASGLTADGWIGIIHNDEPAWISAKAIA